MYCGFATAANKIRWIVFGVLVFIFAALIIAWGVVLAQLNQLNKALDECYESQGCFKSEGQWYCLFADDVNEYCYDKRDDLVTVYFILLVAWIIALIVVPIPLYVMCCCTKKPSSTSGVVQMATYKASPYPY